MQLPEPAVLFEDDFADPGFAARWEVVDLATRHGPSQWSVRKGVLRQTSNCYTPNSHRGALLLARTELEPPYRITARVRSKDDDRFGLAFGYTGPREHLLFWTSAHRSRRTIARIRRGQERALATRRRGYLLDRWYELELVASEDRVQVSIDGEPTVDAPLAQSPAGRAGLYCHANEGLEVSDFRVEQVIGASAAPSLLQWRVQGDLQTVVALSNVSDGPVWIRVDAWDADGAPVDPSLFHGFAPPSGSGDAPTTGPDGARWRRLDARRSATAVFGPPLTSPGHGHCAITWRAPAPGPRPVLISAWLSDDQGRSWSTPVHENQAR